MRLVVAGMNTRKTVVNIAASGMLRMSEVMLRSLAGKRGLFSDQK